MLPLVLSVAFVATPPAPTPLEVPAALRAITAPPEPSGLAWSPALQRYLVVVDDTGLESLGNRHAPLVLALSAEGRFDEAPVPIRGIGELNDAESICPGPSGTFFLVTSHSANKKGKTPPARRQLLHLALDGRALKVLGKLDLTRDVEGPGLLGTAGIAGPLDMEAVGFHDGRLLLGLKSPLSASGAATLLAIDRPLEALKRGRVLASELRVALQPRLCVETKAGPVCQGITDVSFLADGSLVLAANAPKAGPADGGGALWMLKTPFGPKPAAPELLRRFEGLKPEGLAPAPDGRGLRVLFDRGAEAPTWALVP